MLTKQQKRKCVKHARSHPIIVLEAIEETIQLGHDTECIDVPRLEVLRDNYKLWVAWEGPLDNDVVAGIFVASKFPNVRREYAQERWRRMNEFFTRRN